MDPAPSGRTVTAEPGPLRARQAQALRPSWLIVVGGSAGALEPAQHLLAALPPDLDAAVVVVIHGSAEYPSHLPEIFARSTRLSVGEAVHGEPLVRGRLYCAPRDNHVTVMGGALHVVRGPRENGHRPAVDPLFRSAAASYGAAAVAVILSGTRTCGTNGSRLIKAAGGRVLVQSPEEAPFPAMPSSAIEHHAADEVLGVQALGPRLVEIAGQPAPPRPTPRGEGALEPGMTGTRLSCPACGGVLVRKDEGGGAEELSCRTGHRYDLPTLALEHEPAIESALWSAVRMLEEGAEIADRLRQGSSGSMLERYRERAETLHRQAAMIRDLLMHGARS